MFKLPHQISGEGDGFIPTLTELVKMMKMQSINTLIFMQSLTASTKVVRINREAAMELINEVI